MNSLLKFLSWKFLKPIGVFFVFAAAYTLDYLFPMFNSGEIMRAEPISSVLGIISVIATVASTGVGIYSAVASGEAKSEAAESQVAAERQQQEMIDTQKEQARLAYEQKAADYQRRAKAALSTERALRGASGITMEGSPLLVYYENAKIYQEDVERLRQGFDVTEKGLMQQRKLHGIYAEQYGNLAKQEQTAGYIKAGTTLLTGATDVWSQGKRFNLW